MKAVREKKDVGLDSVPNRAYVLYLLLCFIIGIQGLACFGIRPYPRYSVNRKSVCLKRAIDAYLGTPYKWGGQDRDGMDCSGLVVAVYREALGISLPHSTQKLFSMGRRVGKNWVRFGDLVFFSEEGGKATHVGICLGGDRFVHSSTERGVTISSLDTPFFRERYVVTKRIGL